MEVADFRDPAGGVARQSACQFVIGLAESVGYLLCLQAHCGLLVCDRRNVRLPALQRTTQPLKG